MTERIEFLESRINRVEKLLYLVLVMTAPNVLTFIQNL